jgi:hypothetical protein
MLTDGILSNPMEKIPWEADSGSSAKEITSLLCNSKFHFHFQKILLLVLFVSQMNLVHTPPTLFL